MKAWDDPIVVKQWDDPKATFDDDVLPFLKDLEQYRAVIVPIGVIAWLDGRWPDWRQHVVTTHWTINEEQW